MIVVNCNNFVLVCPCFIKLLTQILRDLISMVISSSNVLFRISYLKTTVFILL